MKGRNQIQFFEEGKRRIEKGEEETERRRAGEAI